jgi:hypothetical protein
VTSGQGELPDNHFHSKHSNHEDSKLLEAKLKAEFWASVGFPAGSRWWEETSITSVSHVSKNSTLVQTDLESTKIIIEPRDSTIVWSKNRAPKRSKDAFFNHRLG